MAQTLQLVLKTTLFHKASPLLITPELVEYRNNSLSKFEIAELRYGVKAIKGYRFVIGRIYCIDIKSLAGSVIKIRLTSLYRVRKNKLGEKYLLIVNTVIENFINNIARDLINNFNDKIDFDILGVVFTQEGIQFDKNTEIISWFDAGSKNYRTYFALFSHSNPNKYKAFQYITDWNTILLRAVTEHILKSEKLL